MERNSLNMMWKWSLSWRKVSRRILSYITIGWKNIKQRNEKKEIFSLFKRVFPAEKADNLLTITAGALFITASDAFSNFEEKLTDKGVKSWIGKTRKIKHYLICKSIFSFKMHLRKCVCLKTRKKLIFLSDQVNEYKRKEIVWNQIEMGNFVWMQLKRKILQFHYEWKKNGFWLLNMD